MFVNEARHIVVLNQRLTTIRDKHALIKSKALFNSRINTFLHASVYNLITRKAILTLLQLSLLVLIKLCDPCLTSCPNQIQPCRTRCEKASPSIDKRHIHVVDYTIDFELLLQFTSIEYDRRSQRDRYSCPGKQS